MSTPVLKPIDPPLVRPKTDAPTACARFKKEEEIQMLMKVRDANSVLVFDPRGIVESDGHSDRRSC